MALRATESDEDALHIGSFLKWPFRRFNGFSSLGHVFNRAVAEFNTRGPQNCNASPSASPLAPASAFAPS
jgi:hypothetical protein